MNSVKTIRSLRELLNKIYLTYGMTLQIPKVILSEIEKEITDTEPRIVERAILGNDVVIRPEPENKRCVHTEHCCKIHGCKYSGDCPVEDGSKSQSMPCQICREQEEDWY
jgi:hypothetical protein